MIVVVTAANFFTGVSVLPPAHLNLLLLTGAPAIPLLDPLHSAGHLYPHHQDVSCHHQHQEKPSERHVTCQYFTSMSRGSLVRRRLSEMRVSKLSSQQSAQARTSYFLPCKRHRTISSISYHIVCSLNCGQGWSSLGGEALNEESWLTMRANQELTLTSQVQRPINSALQKQ